MVYVSSDLHGFPLRSFQTLLKSARFTDDDFLYILGDVIDRNGDGGVETLLWLMEQDNIEHLMGNHESMLLECDFVFREVTNELLDSLTADQLGFLQRWLYNGAEPTMNSINRLRRKDPELTLDLLDYLRDLPLYDAVSLPSGDFLLTHAGLGNFEKGKLLSSYTPHDLLWHRPTLEEAYFDSITTVFGHTPTEYLDAPAGRMLRTKTWIDIDTGAAGGGAPMLLRLDDGKEFYAE